MVRRRNLGAQIRRSSGMSQGFSRPEPFATIHALTCLYAHLLHDHTQTVSRQCNSLHERETGDLEKSSENDLARRVNLVPTVALAFGEVARVVVASAGEHQKSAPLGENSFLGAEGAYGSAMGPLRSKTHVAAYWLSTKEE